MLLPFFEAGCQPPEDTRRFKAGFKCRPCQADITGIVVKPLPSALSQADLLRALGEDGFDGQIAASLGWFGSVFWVLEDWEASEATGWLDGGG